MAESSETERIKKIHLNIDLIQFNICDSGRMTGKILLKHKYHEEEWSFEEMFILRDLRFYQPPFYNRNMIGYMLVMFLINLAEKRNRRLGDKYDRYDLILTPTFLETDDNKKLFDYCSTNNFYLSHANDNLYF